MRSTLRRSGTGRARAGLRVALAVLGVALVVGPGMAAGATGTPAASPGAAIAHPNAPDALILRIRQAGGLVPVGRSTTELPQFSLYGDGRVITLGPQIAIFPPPALPNLQVTRLNEAGIQAVLHAARDAGLLDGDQVYLNGNVMDAPTTVFTAVANGKITTVSAEALGIGEDTLPADEQAARAKLIAFAGHALDVESWLPADVVAPATSYKIERLQAIAAPAASSGATAEPGGTPMDWPLATPLAQFGSPASPPVVPNSRCGVVTGDEATHLVAALAHANAATLWRSEGTLYALYPRPLLPDEAGCPARPVGTPAA